VSSSGIVAGTPRDQASDEGAERNFVALACLPPPRNRTRAIVFCWMPLDQRRGRGRAVPCGMRGAGNPSPAAARLPEPLRSGDHPHGVHARILCQSSVGPASRSYRGVRTGGGSSLLAKPEHTLEPAMPRVPPAACSASPAATATMPMLPGSAPDFACAATAWPPTPGRDATSPCFAVLNVPASAKGWR